MKNVQYRIEAFFLRLLFAGFRALPLDISSALGALIVRCIGPFFSANKTAKKNLAMAFPDLNAREIQRIVDRMWNNIGRTGAEYASLPGHKFDSRIEVIGEENLPKKSAIMFSGHLGNWELLCHVAHARGTELSIVYRHTNNPYVDKLIADLRRPHTGELIAKGLRGGVKILGALKREKVVALLIDQKQNNGIAVPFFGRDAMTSPAIAEIALKFDLPIVPSRVVRTGGAHFKTIIYPPIIFEKTGDHEKDVLAVMTQINSILEGWIREQPEQWFWVHRRWPKA